MKIDRQTLFRFMIPAGLALLAAGYLRYSVQETMGALGRALLIAGGVLLAAGGVLNAGAIRAYFRRRSARLGVNTAVMTTAFVVILGLVNFLGYRHHKRVDVTSEKLFSLSEQTRQIVSGLQKDVKVIRFDKTDDLALRDLMQEYRDLSVRVSYERVDPQVKPDVAKQYGVSRMGEVVVVSGDRTERPQDTGEQHLTSSILKVTREGLKTVCFVEGHGERQLTSAEAEGYDLLDSVLKDENYETKSVNLVTANQVPSECAVLVLAGPRQSLFPQEAEMIGRYLDAGGKALLMVDPDTDPKLGEVLKAWNIELGADTVVDVSGVGRLFGTGPAVPLVQTYGAHPITKDMTKTMTFFPLARSVKVADALKTDVTVTELLKTSEDSWAETELKDGKVRYDEGRDAKGPITIGVAASRAAGDKEARLVVIGDSDFATNNYARLQRNGDLFMNTINWLAQDEELISIRPKDPADRRVMRTSSQRNVLFWLTLLLMPGAVLASGIYVWWKRR